MIPQYIKDTFITLGNPLSEDATLETKLVDVVYDSLEYIELLEYLGLPDDSDKFKTIGDLLA
jgi:hypothetical protein